MSQETHARYQAMRWRTGVMSERTKSNPPHRCWVHSLNPGGHVQEYAQDMTNYVLHGPDYIADPYPTYRAMAEEAPVWLQEETGHV